MTNNTMKKIELGVNTKSVKVQFNTSTPTFRDVMGNYWVAVVELADMTKIYSNNVRILSESVARLNEKVEKGETLSENEAKRLELDSAELKVYTDKFMAYREECNKRFEECYKLVLTSGLYNAYNAYATKQDKTKFKKELGVFLASHNIEVTSSLVDFLLAVVGMRTAPANTKVKSKGTTLLIAQTERRFNELFMHALSQLMVDKNCIKTDKYTFTYEKASEVHIDSKIDTVELPEEKTEEPKEPKAEKKTFTCAQLKELLDKSGVSYKKSMRFSELFDLYKTIEKAEESTEEIVTVDYNSMKVAELKALAKDKGVKGYAKMKKEELVKALCA